MDYLLICQRISRFERRTDMYQQMFQVIPHCQPLHFFHHDELKTWKISLELIPIFHRHRICADKFRPSDTVEPVDLFHQFRPFLDSEPSILSFQTSARRSIALCKAAESLNVSFMKQGQCFHLVVVMHFIDDDESVE